MVLNEEHIILLTMLYFQGYDIEMKRTNLFLLKYGGKKDNDVTNK